MKFEEIEQVLMKLKCGREGGGFGRVGACFWVVLGQESGGEG